MSHWNFSSRHFSQCTKKCIFKNFNLRKKADRNFRGNILKNHFEHLTLYSYTPGWLARSRCHMGTFWKANDWSSSFWESQLFRFDTWKFNGKEDLNPGKQTFVLNLRFLPSQKSKVWFIFDGKKSLNKKFL